MEGALAALGKSIARWTDTGGLLGTAIPGLSLARPAGGPAGYPDPGAAHPAGNPVPAPGGRARGAAAPDRGGGQSEPADRAGHRMAETALHPPAPHRGPRH